MTVVVRTLVLATAATAFAFAPAIYAQTTVSPLSQAETHRDCGCTFEYARPRDAHHRTMLVWSYASSGVARLDGKLVNFEAPETLIRPIRNGKNSVRDKMSFAIRKGDYQIYGACEATEVCNAGDASCEWTIYRAKIDVVGPQGKTTIRARGTCGC